VSSTKIDFADVAGQRPIDGFSTNLPELASMIVMLNATRLAELAFGFEGRPSSNALEAIPVFDALGQCIGAAPRILCHRLGLIHKVVYCFIFDDAWEILLQARGEETSESGTIDVPVGGHVTVSDLDDLQALTREAREELGADLDSSRLQSVATYFREAPITSNAPREINREIRNLFAYHLASNEREVLASNFNARAETTAVSSVKWYTIHEAVALCDGGRAADGLVSALPHLLHWKERYRLG
jgi:isopentenyldiphosphate isomerase